MVCGLDLVSEYNALGVLFHFSTLPGAYTRGATEAEAFAKVGQEAAAYGHWAGIQLPNGNPAIVERHQAKANLRLDDADTEVLLNRDCYRLNVPTSEQWCALAMRSAECFEVLFQSIHDKDWVQSEKLRPTFHGKTPATAREMLLHADIVSAYYLSRIGLCGTLKEGRLADNRTACIEALRSNRKSEFRVYETDGELWTETKVLRRYIWHDRIHGKALYRHGLKMGMVVDAIVDTFGFSSAQIAFRNQKRGSIEAPSY